MTVTDDKGATGTTSHQVSVSPGAVTPFAADEFGREVSGGWGVADIGGAWTRSGSAANFSVTGGVGRIRMSSAGAGPGMTLSSVSQTDTDVRVQLGADKAATGGGIYLTVQPRVLATGDKYFADVRLVAGDGVAVTLGRTVGGTDRYLLTRTIAGLGVVPGTLLQARVQAVGTSPTTLRAKVWAVGTPEPSSWSASVTDTTTALQAPGGIGLHTYLSGSATNAPVFGIFDNLSVGEA